MLVLGDSFDLGRLRISDRGRIWAWICVCSRCSKGNCISVYFQCPSLVLSCEEREQLAFEGMSSSSVQQVLLSWEGCNSFLYHKSWSSTTTWRRRGRSTRRSSLLRVYVPPPSLYIHPQLLHYTALFPRAQRIETKAALRHQGTWKFSCGVPLCVSVFCLLLSSQCVFCSRKSHDLIIIFISLPKQMETFDTICARCNTSSWFPSDQST